MATKIWCHYEVLGVERDTTSDGLKKSYRKLALKFHPDKNPENVEEATAQFRLVQQAYEILSDPQERAWYDKHREAILRGGLGGGDKYEDDSLNVFQYFNSTCYNGHGDDDEGFYAVYRKVFETLAEEDYVFMPDRKKDEEFPGFGDPTSDYDEVVGPFYAFWTSFCTNKSYVWVEKYDTREAPDRRTRRAMEQENTKLRNAAKKERNEEIRNLAAFVRKRDKRVQAYKKKLEERHAEIERKSKEKREQQIREQHQHLADYQEAGWSAMSERDLDALEAHLDRHLGEATDAVAEQAEDNADLSADENADEEGLYLDELYCVACNKAFKSEKAFINHEKSKKHREMVEILAEEMRREEDEEGNLSGDEDENNLSGSDETETPSKTATELPKTESGGKEQDVAEVDGLLSEDDEDLSEVTQQRASKKKKKKRRQKNLADAEEDIIAEKVAEISLSEESSVKQSAKSKKARRRAAQAVTEDNEEDSIENESPIEIAVMPETPVTSEPPGEASQQDPESSLDPAGEARESGEERLQGEGMDERDQKDRSDSATVVEGEVVEEERQPKKGKNKKPKDTEKCKVCQRGFPSRNKLFEHIKQTGHATRIESAQQESLNTGEDDRGNKGRKKNKR